LVSLDVADGKHDFRSSTGMVAFPYRQSPALFPRIMPVCLPLPRLLAIYDGVPRAQCAVETTE
jgi:hypothetical protein